MEQYFKQISRYCNGTNSNISDNIIFSYPEYGQLTHPKFCTHEK